MANCDIVNSVRDLTFLISVRGKFMYPVSFLILSVVIGIVQILFRDASGFTRLTGIHVWRKHETIRNSDTDCILCCTG